MKKSTKFFFVKLIFQTRAIIKKGQFFVLIFHSSSLMQISMMLTIAKTFFNIHLFCILIFCKHFTGTQLDQMKCYWK